MRYYRVPGQKRTTPRGKNARANKGRAGAFEVLTREDRERLKDFLRGRDGELCGICRHPLEGEASIDHVVPRIEGGGDHVSNLRLTHHECNNRRGEWGEW